MSIVQKLGQSIRIDFGQLCDAERDSYSTHVFETAELIAIGLVVGTYYEWTSLKRSMKGFCEDEQIALAHGNFELNRRYRAF